jgi:predicted N-acetyltransferase YhbS
MNARLESAPFRMRTAGRLVSRLRSRFLGAFSEEDTFFETRGLGKLPATVLEAPMVQVEPLCGHPERIRVLARWHFGEWSHLYPEWTAEAVERELSSHVDPSRIPTTLVAVEDGELIGSVSLIEHDGLPGWEHLTPWLASLYVRSDRRGRGIGRRLVKETVAEARRLGVHELYLFTPGQRDFYSGLGWNVVAETVCGPEPVTVMSVVPLSASLLRPLGLGIA